MLNYLTTNQNNNNSGNRLNQFDQALDQSAKKTSYLCHRLPESQVSHTLATSVNVTSIKKDKKMTDKNSSQAKYYNYHKKSYNTNISLNKESKNWDRS